MNARMLKFANRVYKIFKVYAALALGGALATVVVQLILAKPLPLLVALGSISFLTAVVWLWAKEHKSVIGKDEDERFLKLQTRKPRKL